MNTQKQILVIVVLFFTLVGGCAAYTIIDLPYRGPDQETWTKNQSIERGALLFANNCRNCHGIKGQGGIGLPLNKPEFQNNEDPLVLKANRQLLQTTLSCGRAGTLMPAWLNTNGGALNARQIEHLMDLITAPPELGVVDEEGNPTSKGWLEAVEFARNLNHHEVAIVNGDNLDGIASGHGIGYGELADANGLPVEGVLEKGSTLNVPGFKLQPDGYVYHVYNDNETIRKVADSQHVGAIIIADLNDLPYNFSEKKGKTTFTLLNDAGEAAPGLFPGTTLRLPEGATYTLVSGDTVESIAAHHGLTESDITSLNREALAGQDLTEPLAAERKLKLPGGTGVVVQPGQTPGIIATQHGLTTDEFLKLNNLQPTSPVAPGDLLKLPATASYVVQIGDTLDRIARAHGLDEAALAAANNLKPGDPISPQVILQLPKVDKFTVNGDTLADVARAYSDVTADTLGAANDIPADAVVRVGQKLKIPEDAWGPAPGTTINPGTACVQHAIPQAAFNTLPGIAQPTAEITAPAQPSKDVKVDAHDNDFTVTADGTTQEPNKGVVSVVKGAAITFANKAGLHTITVNGKNTGTGVDFKPGDTRTVNFPDAGQFKITCDIHPAMLLNVFVQ